MGGADEEIAMGGADLASFIWQENSIGVRISAFIQWMIRSIIWLVPSAEST